MKIIRLGLTLCGAILILGIVGCFWVMRPTGSRMVEILQDGAILYTFDLSSAEDEIFSVETENGINKIQIQDGTIQMLSADCPDQTCVQMGPLSETGLPIVCLPHRLVIQYTADTETDSATG